MQTAMRRGALAATAALTFALIAGCASADDRAQSDGANLAHDIQKVDHVINAQIDVKETGDNYLRVSVELDQNASTAAQVAAGLKVRTLVRHSGIEDDRFGLSIYETFPGDSDTTDAPSAPTQISWPDGSAVKSAYTSQLRVWAKLAATGFKTAAMTVTSPGITLRATGWRSAAGAAPTTGAAYASLVPELRSADIPLARLRMRVATNLTYVQDDVDNVATPEIFAAVDATAALTDVTSVTVTQTAQKTYDVAVSTKAHHFPGPVDMTPIELQARLKAKGLAGITHVTYQESTDGAS